MMANVAQAQGGRVVLLNRVALETCDKDVAILTLNRPDRLNCFNEQVCCRLASAVASLVDDNSVAAVILTGAGTSFCAGADLSNPPNPIEQSSDLLHCLAKNPVHQMSLLRVPLIGALQGHVSQQNAYPGSLPYTLDVGLMYDLFSLWLGRSLPAGLSWRWPVIF